MAWSLGVTLQEAQFFPVRIDCQNAIWLLEGQEIRSIFQINKVATNVKKKLVLCLIFTRVHSIVVAR